MSLPAHTRELPDKDARDAAAPDPVNGAGGSADGTSLDARPVVGWRRALRSVRSPHWWYFTPLPLTSLVGDVAGDLDTIVRCVCGMAVTALCLAYAYGLNGITDRGMDRNAAKNSLAGLDGVPRDAALLVGGCAIGALGIAAAMTPVALLGAAVSLVAGTLYSALLRLKRLPVIGTFVNVMIFAPLPFLAVSGYPSTAVLFLTYCFWVLLTQNQILHEVSDAAEDEAAGVRTTGVVVGPTGVHAIAFLLGPLAAVPLWSMQTEFVVRFAAVVALCGGAAIVAFCNRERARPLRFRHRVYSLAAGITLFTLLAWGAGGA